MSSGLSNTLTVETSTTLTSRMIVVLNAVWSRTDTKSAPMTLFRVVERRDTHLFLPSALEREGIYAYG